MSIDDFKVPDIKIPKVGRSNDTNLEDHKVFEAVGVKRHTLQPNAIVMVEDLISNLVYTTNYFYLMNTWHAIMKPHQLEKVKAKFHAKWPVTIDYESKKAWMQQDPGVVTLDKMVQKDISALIKEDPHPYELDEWKSMRDQKYSGMHIILDDFN